jgi:hypothetical protein
VYNAGSKDVVLDQDERVFMIWYADLDAPTPDPYPAQTPMTSVIISDDVSRLKGEVASPAELKKQIDEIKHDYDKRLQSVEISEKILQWLVGALILLLLGTMFRAGWFDRNNEARQGSSAAVAQAEQPPASQIQPRYEKGGAVPQQPVERQVNARLQAGEIKGIVGFGSDRLGTWIMGGSLMVSVSILVSAFVIRNRLARPR